MKPPTWPEAVEPTAEEWLDWLLVNDRVDQLRIAELVLEASRASGRCLLENHVGLKDEVRWLRSRAWRYELAWRSARRWRKAFRAWVSGDRLG